MRGPRGTRARQAPRTDTHHGQIRRVVAALGGVAPERKRSPWTDFDARSGARLRQMAGKPEFDREEVDIRPPPEGGGTSRPLVPWWMRLKASICGLRRKPVRSRRGSILRTPMTSLSAAERGQGHIHAQRQAEGGGVGCARSIPDPRRGAAGARKGRGVRPGAWRHRLMARVREWEKAGDELMWRFIVSPEDADRWTSKSISASWRERWKPT